MILSVSPPPSLSLLEPGDVPKEKYQSHNKRVGEIFKKFSNCLGQGQGKRWRNCRLGGNPETSLNEISSETYTYIFCYVVRALWYGNIVIWHYGLPSKKGDAVSDTPCTAITTTVPEVLKRIKSRSQREAGKNKTGKITSARCRSRLQ